MTIRKILESKSEKDIREITNDELRDIFSWLQLGTRDCNMIRGILILTFNAGLIQACPDKLEREQNENT
jgi:hypothetical protein